MTTFFHLGGPLDGLDYAAGQDGYRIVMLGVTAIQCHESIPTEQVAAKLIEGDVPLLQCQCGNDGWGDVLSVLVTGIEPIPPTGRN